MTAADRLTLIVLRHAKSSWKEPGLDDHDRPLNKRGVRDAPRMGRLLRAQSLLPDRVLCSTAVRARTTAQAALAAAGATCEVVLTQDLYLASAARIVELMAVSCDRQGRVMIVGHNPGLGELVTGLTGVPVTLPTAALARIECGVDLWRDLQLRGPARLVDLWKPREIPD